VPGQATIEHARDVRVLHQRQRLPFLLEAAKHRPRVHARLDHLQRHALHEGLAPLRQPDRAKATLAKR
jgi:hypothetical protein